MLRANLKNDILLACVFLAVVMIVSLTQFSTIHIKPNIFLVASLVAGLLIEGWLVLAGFVVVELIWLKFTPNFIAEYALMFFLALFVFFLFKFFVINKVVLVRVFVVLLIQVIFYAALGAAGGIFSLVFALELIYNVILEELLFGLGSWLKKKSF